MLRIRCAPKRTRRLLARGQLLGRLKQGLPQVFAWNFIGASLDLKSRAFLHLVVVDSARERARLPQQPFSEKAEKLTNRGRRLYSRDTHGFGRIAVELVSTPKLYAPGGADPVGSDSLPLAARRPSTEKGSFAYFLNPKKVSRPEGTKPSERCFISPTGGFLFSLLTFFEGVKE